MALPGRSVEFGTWEQKEDSQKGDTLYLNGVEAEQEYIVEEGIQTPSCAHMPEGVSGTTMENWK